MVVVPSIRREGAPHFNILIQYWYDIEINQSQNEVAAFIWKPFHRVLWIMRKRGGSMNFDPFVVFAWDMVIWEKNLFWSILSFEHFRSQDQNLFYNGGKLQLRKWINLHFSCKWIISSYKMDQPLTKNGSKFTTSGKTVVILLKRRCKY